MTRRRIQGNVASLPVEDVFSSYVYEGTGASLSITNDIDLSGEGGLVWIKNRDQTDSHILTDTERGATNTLSSDTTAAEVADADTLTAFNADGFTLGADVKVNTSAEDYVSWTFRKARKFFDIVTYTGNSTADRDIPHNLGVAPGMMIVKKYDGSELSAVYHRSEGATKQGILSSTNAFSASSNWSSTEPTDSVFTVGGFSGTNETGFNYVAYLFAHDTTDGGIIQCGEVVGTTEVNLGWEPQYILFKRSDSAQDWFVFDSARGIVTGGSDPDLNPNLSDAEGLVTNYIEVTATGFINKAINGGTSVYMAIRRPMKTPTSGDEVFAIDTLGSTADGKAPGYRAPFAVDAAILRTPVDAVTSNQMTARLTQGTRLLTDSTAAESVVASFVFDYMNGWFDNTSTSSNYYSWMFKRAPGFFDVVCYEGTGVSKTEAHNLGAVPELMICKGRSAITSWATYHKDIGNTGGVYLNLTGAEQTSTDWWNDTSPTDAGFTVGALASTNQSGVDFVSYLFASLPGVSKVGSYTGNGTNQTIDCGFSTGARFVLIKRIDDTGDWYVWDTERGIVAGDDPHLSLNTTAAEVTTDDSIDSDTSGFIVNQDAATNINVDTASYIFLAVA